MAWLLPFSAIPMLGIEAMDSIHESARKWIDIRLETSQLQTDWLWQKNLLGSMQEALEFKVSQFEEREALLVAQMATEKQKVEQTREQVKQLREELATLEEHNQQMIEKLQSLKMFLPSTLSDSLELAFSSLSDPALSTGEKMQLVVTILNRCTQFNDKITYGEVIAPSSTEEKEHVLCVLYWGLSHAYALDQETGDTYLGKPVEKGWNWIPSPGLESEVRRLIDIFNEESDPDLVKAPVHINTSEFE